MKLLKNRFIENKKPARESIPLAKGFPQTTQPNLRRNANCAAQPFSHGGNESNPKRGRSAFSVSSANIALISRRCQAGFTTRKEVPHEEATSKLSPKRQTGDTLCEECHSLAQWPADIS